MTRRHAIAPRRVFVDVESGGLDANRHPLIQVAAVAFDIDWHEVERFEVKLMFDEATCDTNALKKISYDRRLWNAHAVQPLTAYQRFCYFLREHATLEKVSRTKGVPYHVARLFAHNASFDSSFLWRWHEMLRCENPDLFLPADRHVICTLQTALILFDQEQTIPRPIDYKLGTLCEYFGVPFSTNEAHDALYDCLAAARLYHAMTTGEEQEIHLRHAA